VPRLLPPLLLPLLLAAAGAAAAEPAPLPDTGVYVGVRAGIGAAVGHVERGEEARAVSELFDFALPLHLDLGYRFSPALRVGVYAMYAPLSTHTFCPAGLSCRASSVRLGVAGEYHLATRRRLHGWVGLGLGYERSGVEISGGGVDVETRYGGAEWLGLSVGADYRLWSRLSIGPALTWTFARYLTRTSRLGTGAGSEAIGSPALHSWALVGARANWEF
jgi:hypothetical protein